MANDIIITPANGDIEFYITSGSTIGGKIEQSGDDLVLSNAVGDVLLGDGTSDVYIGDGTNSVDIVFEQNGSIRGEAAAGVTLTLGSNDTTLYLTGSTLALQKDGGNVGIGTTSPSEKLEVAGNVILDSSDARIKIKGGVAGTNSGIDWTFNTDATQYAKIELDYDTRTTTGLLIDSGYPITLDYTSGAFSVKKNGTSELTILNGNVGIGTTSPSQKLEVRDGGVIVSGSTPRILFDHPNLTYQHDLLLKDAGQGQLHYRYGNGTKIYFDNHSIRFGDYASGTGTNSNIYDPRIAKEGSGAIAGGLQFFTNNTARMSISGSTGYVGIGTTSPSELFQVNTENAETIVSIARGGSNLSTSTPIGKLSFDADYNGSLINYGYISLGSNDVSGVRGSMDFAVKSTTGNILTGMTLYGTNAGVNVGIGTTTPDYQLEVNAGTENNVASFASTDSVAQLRIIDSSATPFYFGVNGTTAYISPTGATPADGLAVKSTGEVGIGTSSPQALLHVEGNISSSGTITLDNVLYFTSTSNEIRTTDESGHLYINPDGVLYLGQDRTDHTYIGRQNNTSYTTRIFGGTSTVAILVGDPYVELNVPVTASGNVDIQGVLSIPGFNNVSSSLAAAVAGGDDLGNHTASLDLNMANNNIVKVTSIKGTGTGQLFIDAELDDVLVQAQTIALGNPTYNIFLHSDGHITASGNISASGTVVGSNLSGTNTGDQDLSGYIQASQTSSMYVFSASAASIATLAFSASNAAEITLNTVSADADYGLVLRDGNATGPQTLYADTEVDTPAWNPSTNTLTVLNISSSNITASIVSSSGGFIGDLTGTASYAETVKVTSINPAANGSYPIVFKGTTGDDLFFDNNTSPDFFYNPYINTLTVLNISSSNITASGIISASGTSDNYYGGRTIQDNDTFIAGKETGGSTRNILGIDSSNLVQVGNANLTTTVKGTYITLNGSTKTEITSPLIFLSGSTKIKREITSTTHGDASGEIVYFGGATGMDVGQIYYFGGVGPTWSKADASGVNSSTLMLGVALGAASDTDGVLLRGMVTLDHDPGNSSQKLYLSTTAGQATNSAPTGSSEAVRLIGYCLDNTNGQIYFNPSNDWIELT